MSSYMRTNVAQKGHVKYFDRRVWVEFPQEREGGNQLNIGKVLFSRAGVELAPLSGAQPREGFVDFVKEQWKKFGIKNQPPPSVQNTSG